MRGWRLALCLAPAGLALLPSGGAAAPYQVQACGGGRNASWVPNTTSLASYAVSQRCPPAGDESGLLLEDNLGADTPAQARAEWSFTAPPGTTITRLDALRWALASGDDGWEVYLRADGTVLESCQPGPGLLTCVVGTRTPTLAGATPVAFAPLAAQQLAYGIVCTNQTSCANGQNLHNAGVSLQSATVTLEDPTPPQVTAVSGPLKDAPGVLTGVQTLTVGASDQGGGVSRIGLVLAGGGSEIASASLPCDYTRPVPCPLTTSQVISLDTRTLFDGGTLVQVVAADASGARTFGPTFTFHNDNSPPGAPGSFFVYPKSPAVGRPFRVGWVNSDAGEVPVTEARWRLLAPGGAVARQGIVRGTSPQGIDGLVLRRPGTWRLERLLAAWLAQVYHHRVHSETGESPHARYRRVEPRYPEPERLREAFLWRAERMVNATALVSLAGNRYEVAPELAGRRVELLYDPHDLTQIQVRHRGRAHGQALPHRIARHVHQAAEDPTAPEPAPASGIDYLELVERAEQGALRRRIAYRELGSQDEAGPR